MDSNLISYRVFNDVGVYTLLEDPSFTIEVGNPTATLPKQDHLIRYCGKHDMECDISTLRKCVEMLGTLRTDESKVARYLGQRWTNMLNQTIEFREATCVSDLCKANKSVGSSIELVTEQTVRIAKIYDKLSLAKVGILGNLVLLCFYFIIQLDYLLLGIFLVSCVVLYGIGVSHARQNIESDPASPSGTSDDDIVL